MPDYGRADAASAVLLVQDAQLSYHKRDGESLRAKRDRKSAISLQRGQFDPKFQVKLAAPTNHFCTDS